MQGSFTNMRIIDKLSLSILPSSSPFSTLHLHEKCKYYLLLLFLTVFFFPWLLVLILVDVLDLLLPALPLLAQHSVANVIRPGFSSPASPSPRQPAHCSTQMRNNHLPALGIHVRHACFASSLVVRRVVRAVRCACQPGIGHACFAQESMDHR